MEKKLVVKMIRNCFKQYYEAVDSMPISDQDLEELTRRILKTQEEDPDTNLYEVVNDTVYEFLTS